MKRLCLPLFILVIVFLPGFTVSVGSDPVKDYLNVPGPIKFDNASYYLSWSDRKNDIYYFQEYIPRGDKVEHFNKMILVNVIDDSISPLYLATQKINELEERKKTDLVVNYRLTHNPEKTEYMLDFILSQGSPVLDLVEWNVYRYKVITGANGKKGVLLLGNSIRSYGNDITPFMKALTDTRNHVIKALIDYPVPEIKIQ